MFSGPNKPDSAKKILAIACAGLMVAVISVPAQAGQERLLLRLKQNRQQRRILRQQNRPNAANKGANKAKLSVVQDQNALALIKKMLHPLVDYSGDQVTQIAQSGQTSHQTIKCDMKGRVRLDYLEPGSLNGDTMLILPGQYHYYHRATNKEDVAVWPTQRDAFEKRMTGLIQQRKVAVTIEGSQQIAGRNATIVQLTPQSGTGLPGQMQIRFWIDPETGIQLKNERLKDGMTVSKSELTSVRFGTEAAIGVNDFKPSFPGAMLNPLFPTDSRPEFSTIEEASPHVPFPILQPNQIPTGYALSGVWVFGGQNKTGANISVLLRYSNGVAPFSLYQRRAKAGQPVRPYRANRRAAASIQRWHILSSASDLDVIYIGHLSAADEQTVHDSLR